MTALQQGQSEQPYITVGVDDRGSTCWMVISNDQRVMCASGHRALVILAAMFRSRGVNTPT
jgi:hypothetical protein